MSASDRSCNSHQSAVKRARPDRPSVSPFLAAIALVLSACSSDQVANAPGIKQVRNAVVQSLSASPANLRLSQDGTGKLTLPNQTQNLSNVTVNAQNNGTASLSLQPTSGQAPLQMTGQIQSRTPDSVAVQVTGINNQPASGIVEFSYGQDNVLRNLQGNGKLNGQPFSVAFNTTTTVQNPGQTAAQPAGSQQQRYTTQADPGSSPQSSPSSSPASGNQNQGQLLNLVQQGQGAYQLGNQSPLAIVTASLVQNNPQNADLYLSTGTGDQIRLSGDITFNGANSLTMRLANTGNDQSAGTVYVDYTPEGSISNISGSGTLNSQPFSLQFAPQLAQQPGAGVPITQQPQPPSQTSNPPVYGLW